MARTIATGCARVLAVLLAAYAAVRLGDSWAVAWTVYPWGVGAEPEFRGEGMMLTVLAAIIICSVPALRFDLIPGENDKVRTGPLAWSLFYVSACWLYGVFATPHTVYGQNPLLWLDNVQDPYALIPVLSAIPILVIALGKVLPNAEDRTKITAIFCGE